MNERIRELARKVDPELAKETIYCTANDLEKFAELIIRECAEVLDTWNKENRAEEGLDKEGLISLWSPHFGVK